MSISVQNITKLYGEQRALNNVSFEINSGEVVGFLGPNGAGKSTMMKILTCYLPQSSGQASVCGHNVNSHSIEVRKRVGYLPEHNPLYLDMYVKEYLGFIAGLHRVPGKKQRVAEIIEMVGLEREQRKRIQALSKGYRQRVGLAQALIHDPEVLILDEPTSGLDPNQISEIRDLIKNVGQSKTVMMSTHIMQEVEAICDRVIIINQGKVVADDRAANLRQSRQNSQAVEVEFDSELSASQLKKIDGVREAKSIGKNTWVILSNKEGDLRSKVFQFAVDQKVSVLTLKEAEQRLEDVFKDLTASGSKSGK